MLDSQRSVAIGNAKKAEEVFDAGNELFFVLFSPPTNSLPIPARETCIQANHEKIASIIIYKARKAEIKEKKEVRPNTHAHAHAHAHAHTNAQAKSEFRHEKLIFQMKVKDYTRKHRAHQGKHSYFFMHVSI